MKKAEALAKQKQTIEDVLRDDRGSDIVAIAELFTAAELVSDTKDYTPEEMSKLIPWGNTLRELEFEHQTEAVARAARDLDKPVEEYPADHP